ncbi:MAG: hypothetical protein AUF67_04160 [Acidobacteria bacterium 13_1_20CM_58_21]|nr:MAG: hypothetical protein AUF67_04160 [Acidobacteria bacterium 13_1_20CM_58_21]
MLSRQAKLFSSVVLVVAFMCSSVSAQQAKRPFMVAEDIKLTLFAPQCGGTPEVHFSPDGKYFAVWTERGILERDSSDPRLRRIGVLFA